MSMPRLILKCEHWPEQDRAAWCVLFEEGSIFDGRGACVNWSTGSRRKREQSYGYWLSFLTRADLVDESRSPADRFTQETVLAFVDDARRRASLSTASTQAVDLYVLAGLFDPQRDWSWFKRFVVRLQGQTDRWQIKPRKSVSSADVLDWALSELAATEAMELDAVPERPVRFRDALMVALLISRPLRRRTFASIEIDKHLVALNGGYLLRFAPEDMKDQKPHEWTVPVILVEPLRRYLTLYRPVLLRGNETDKLWVSCRGGALTAPGLAIRLARVTERAFGEALRPHAFRHIAATSIAEEDPAHVNVIASLLGHTTLAMSEKHYNRANGVKAAARYQDMIGAKRREARQRARTLRALRANAAAGDVAD